MYTSYIIENSVFYSLICSFSTNPDGKYKCYYTCRNWKNSSTPRFYIGNGINNYLYHHVDLNIGIFYNIFLNNLSNFYSYCG